MGHLEGAAGIAGFIKLVLVLQHRTAPPNLHLKKLNPHLDIDGFPVVMPSEAVEIGVGRTAGGERRGKLIGAVSSFGFGGANAHVVVEEGDAPIPPLPPTLAADAPETSTARVTVPSKFAIPPLPPTLAADAPETSTARVTVPSKFAFLFTGQGSQYVGMCRGLYEQEEAFRSVLDRCERVVSEKKLWGGEMSLKNLLFPSTEEEQRVAETQIDQTQFAQVALFAIEVALFELWRSKGVVPDVVMGHSLGEYAAAVASGVMSVEKGLVLVERRARAMQALPPSEGVMAACRVGEADVITALDTLNSREESIEAVKNVAIAAVNGPKSVVVAGPRPGVALVLSELGVATSARFLAVSHAFHSPLMSAAREEFAPVLEETTLQEPKEGIRLVSTVTGLPVCEGELTVPEHWLSQIERPVRFAEAVRSCVETLGCSLLVELGPQPVLINMSKSCVSAEKKASVRWLHSSLRSPDDTESFSKALSAAMREISSQAPSADPTQSGAGLWQHAAFPFAPLTHPLVGTVVESREGTRVQAVVRREVHALVDHHDLRGEIVVPGAHHLDTMAACVGRLLASGRVTSGDLSSKSVEGEEVEGGMPRPRVCLENVFFERPLMLPHLKDLTEETRHRVTVSVSPSREVTLKSTGGAAESQSDWEESEETHVRADVSSQTAFKQTEVDIEAVKNRLPQKADIEAFYKGFKQIGYILGPRFRTVREAWISEENPNEILAALRPEAAFDDQKGERMREVDLAYDVHPAVLDGCFQSGALRFASDNESRLFVPVEIQRVVLGCLRVPWDAPDKPTAFVHAELVSKTETAKVVDLRLTDAAGRVVAEVIGMTSRPMDVSRAAPIPRDLLWSVAWKRPSPVEGEGKREGEGQTATETFMRASSSGPPRLFVGVSAENADAIARLIPNSKILPSVRDLPESQLLEGLSASGCDQILFLGSAGEGVERADGAAAAVVWEATRVLQAVSSPEWPKETPRPSVRFVTVGEQSSARGGSAGLSVSPAAARGSHCGLLGLARSAAVEMQNFGVKVGSADLDPTAPVPFPEAM
eukprot:Cvel_33368.t1-p1 / transcript=Cvel_33368.t1 / gene=Cvel_33368 / organism=Chromera_velia_CCMP2878 / gene_product=Phenolphthiocerol synthesis polyketide synthase, putative / transcript_product=Phenolphthiocerol synthesis polyketide synthase, putative / location=Cvel_scaffold5398:1-3144(-) / protein_length=1048 / sequence_SO=supercontig / SO=protein_coding / is_pseudo=false